MKSLKQKHFYYGAILAAIMEYNPEASLVLLERHNDNRGRYKIQTNNSRECIVFFKHAFEKSNGSQSWLFQLTPKEKDALKLCYQKQIPAFIFLLCAVDNLKGSEIAILKYDEFKEIEHKKNFTISVKKILPAHN